MAKDIYEQHFRVAQAVPRGVVAKMCALVKQLEAACSKHVSEVCCKCFYSNYCNGLFL